MKKRIESWSKIKREIVISLVFFISLALFKLIRDYLTHHLTSSSFSVMICPVLLGLVCLFNVKFCLNLFIQWLIFLLVQVLSLNIFLWAYDFHLIVESVMISVAFSIISSTFLMAIAMYLRDIRYEK